MIENLYQKNYELDYDPFIKAQDYHISILDSIKIKKDSKDNGSYSVSYKYKNQSESERVYIEVQLIEVNGSFKIDNVNGIK